MANIHDLAREFLAGEGIKMSSVQSRAIFLFADWLLAKQHAAQQGVQSDGALPPLEVTTDPAQVIKAGYRPNAPRR